MRIEQIKNSLSMLNNMDEKSLDDMFNKHWIDTNISMKWIKEDVKWGVFNILK